MPEPSLDFVVVEHPEMEGAPLIISVESFESGEFNVWTGKEPEGLNPIHNKTADYIPKKAARKKAVKR